MWAAVQSWWRHLWARGAAGGARAGDGAAGAFVHSDWRGAELRFKAGTAQSRMSHWAPERLVVDYTRSMLGALLLQPAPTQVGMVGLGGGSQLKFLHRHLAGARFEVFENDPGVVALRRRFRIPDDDARLTVHLADAAKALPAWAGRFDLLLVDGYDVDGIPAALSTQKFYSDCRASLRPGGVLAANLYDTAHAEHVHRLRIAFGAANVEVVDEARQSNRVAFAWVPPLPAPEVAPALAAAGRRELQDVFERLRPRLAAASGRPR